MSILVTFNSKLSIIVKLLSVFNGVDLMRDQRYLNKKVKMFQVTQNIFCPFFFFIYLKFSGFDITKSSLETRAHAINFWNLFLLLQIIIKHSQLALSGQTISHLKEKMLWKFVQRLCFMFLPISKTFKRLLYLFFLFDILRLTTNDYGFENKYKIKFAMRRINN